MGQRGRHKIIQREWTDVQKYCYNRNCNCRGCQVPNLVPSLHGRCWVKKSIREYIEKYGVPKDIKTKGIIDEKDIETGG